MLAKSPALPFPPHSPEDWIWTIFLLVIGACFGSFLNVCAYRIPRDISVVAPRSFCPVCGEPIPWWRNLPVLSWVLQRGRAACCGASFSGRYALVEALTGVLFVALATQFPLSLAAAYLVLGCLLVVGFCTDLDFLMIPDRVSLGGMVAGLAASCLVPDLHHTNSHWDSFNASLLGAFAGGASLWIIATIGTNVLKREAMGMGDVKLMLAIGAFLGWEAAAFTIMVGSIIGACLGLSVLLLRRQHLGSFVAVPFGPPLMLAAALWVMGGRIWWNAYFAALHGPFR